MSTMAAFPACYPSGPMQFCNCIQCQNSYYAHPQYYFSEVYNSGATAYPNMASSPMYLPPQEATVLPEEPLNASTNSESANTVLRGLHRTDLGYESENDPCQSETRSEGSRPLSPCDSARPESPEEQDLQRQIDEVEKDLAGFRMSGARPVDMALSQRMELVWHSRFNEFFERFPSARWYLFPVFDPPDVSNTGIARNQWRYYKDQAKVRFICNKCQKAWTSMGGQVVFWIYKDDANNVGYIHFKLYGQKCSDCTSEFYEHAIWYQEEVEKVIENLYHHVGVLYYGFDARKKRVDRRLGHPKREHNSATCQACSEHICRMGQRRKPRDGA